MEALRKIKSGTASVSMFPVAMSGLNSLSHFVGSIQEKEAKLACRIIRRTADSIKEHERASRSQHIDALNVRSSMPASRVDAARRRVL